MLHLKQTIIASNLDVTWQYPTCPQSLKREGKHKINHWLRWNYIFKNSSGLDYKLCCNVSVQNFTANLKTVLAAIVKTIATCMSII